MQLIEPSLLVQGRRRTWRQSRRSGRRISLRQGAAGRGRIFARQIRRYRLQNLVLPVFQPGYWRPSLTADNLNTSFGWRSRSHPDAHVLSKGVRSNRPASGNIPAAPVNVDDAEPILLHSINGCPPGWVEGSVEGLLRSVSLHGGDLALGSASSDR